MRVLAGRGFGPLSPEACREVVEFIGGSGGTRQLSMRHYEASLKKVAYAIDNGIDWAELVRSQLDQLGQKANVPQPLDTKGHDLTCMALAIEAHPHSVRQQEEFWCEATGKSRASFFRTK